MSDLYDLPAYELRVELRRAREELRQEVLRRLALSATLDKTLKEKTVVEGTCASLCKVRDKLKEQRDKLEEDVGNLRGDVDTLSSNAQRMARTIAELKESKWPRLGRIRELEKLLAATTEQRDALITSCYASESMVITHEREYTKLKEAKDRAEATCASLRRGHNQLREQRDAYEKRVTEGEEKYDTLGKQWSALLVEKNDLQAKVDQRRHDREDRILRQRDHHEKKRKEALSSLQEVRRLLSATTAQRDALVLRVREANRLDLIESKNHFISELATELTQAKEQIRQADRQDDQRCLKLADLQETGEKLAVDLATEQARVRVLERRLGRLVTGENLPSLATRLVISRDQYRTLKKAFNALHQECHALTDYPHLKPMSAQVSERTGAKRICLHCGYEFLNVYAARVKEGHADDCSWVELQDVMAWTEQEILRLEKSEGGCMPKLGDDLDLS